VSAYPGCHGKRPLNGCDSGGGGSGGSGGSNSSSSSIVVAVVVPLSTCIVLMKLSRIYSLVVAAKWQISDCQHSTSLQYHRY